ncbi:kinase-like domain-containing protein [Chaetomium fimeti]|uniref:Kinase-like domain-containing protein n=1 Tax=Chaetomium fimeti TaxID=1854472 RepID=A0AAE0HND3_9PEZI|nr:kinase-like domain-containing protein [Chaetomium fimeti]
MNHNHANYQARLDFVGALLRDKLLLKEEADIVPVQYDPESPFKYNNFVYRVTLGSPVLSSHASSRITPQSTCVPIPDGAKQLIVRLANQETEGMSMANRVENEVAIISLAAAALDGFQPHVVPRVYGWGSAAPKSAQGWIVQELMPGSPLAEVLGEMDLDQKRKTFAQMAALLKGLQSYKLPETITGFGGVTFDDAGRIVGAPMPTVGAGPWPSYEAHFRSRLEASLKKAQDNQYIKGWQPNRLRERLDKFISDGVPAQFHALSSKGDRVITHGDFNASNLLFDPVSGRITGLIDFDFAAILHPSYEFLRSFDGAGGQFRGWYMDEESDEAALRDAKLNGFPSPLPATKADGPVQWEDAKAWEEALEEVGAKRPRTLQGIDAVADVDTVLQGILPWRVTNSDVLKLQTHDTIMQCRDEKEEHLDKLLRRLGF